MNSTGSKTALGPDPRRGKPTHTCPAAPVVPNLCGSLLRFQCPAVTDMQQTLNTCSVTQSMRQGCESEKQRSVLKATYPGPRAGWYKLASRRNTNGSYLSQAVLYQVAPLFQGRRKLKALPNPELHLARSRLPTVGMWGGVRRPAPVSLSPRGLHQRCCLDVHGSPGLW